MCIGLYYLLCYDPLICLFVLQIPADFLYLLEIRSVCLLAMQVCLRSEKNRSILVVGISIFNPFHQPAFLTASLYYNII